MYTSQYNSETYGGGVRFGVPINDDESFQYGLSAEVTTIYLTVCSAQRYIDYVNTFGETTRNLIGSIGWTRDTRDSAIQTTDRYGAARLPGSRVAGIGSALLQSDL